MYENRTLQSASVTTGTPRVYLPGALVLYCIPCFQAKCSHLLILADLIRVTWLTSVLGCVLGML